MVHMTVYVYMTVYNSCTPVHESGIYVHESYTCTHVHESCTNVHESWNHVHISMNHVINVLMCRWSCIWVYNHVHSSDISLPEL